MVTWGQIPETRRRAVPSAGHDRHRHRPDTRAAADRFSTQVHGSLHDRIDALVEEDRAAASDLIDAKFAVESLAQEDDPPGEELRDALERLAAQLSDASGCQA